MKKNTKIIFILLVVVFFHVSPKETPKLFSLPACAQYSYPDVGLPGEGLSDDEPIKDILVSFLEWLLIAIGTIAIISFVVAGLQYMLASGDEEIIKNAKRHLTYSIIGIVVALSGYIIIQAIDAILNADSLI
jgi:hypothetical protein